MAMKIFLTFLWLLGAVVLLSHLFVKFTSPYAYIPTAGDAIAILMLGLFGYALNDLWSKE